MNDTNRGNYSSFDDENRENGRSGSPSSPINTSTKDGEANNNRNSNTNNNNSNSFFGGIFSQIGLSGIEELMNENADTIRHENDRFPFLARIIRSRYFSTLTYGLIMVSLITTSARNFPSTIHHNNVFDALDDVLTFCYFFEAVAKIAVFGPYLSYFKDAWNVFDFVIAVISMVGFALERSNTSAAIGFAGAARIVRLVRLLSISDKIRLLFATLTSSARRLFNIIMLLALFLVLISLVAIEFFEASLNRKCHPVDQALGLVAGSSPPIDLLAMETLPVCRYSSFPLDIDAQIRNFIDENKRIYNISNVGKKMDDGGDDASSSSANQPRPRKSYDELARFFSNVTVDELRYMLLYTNNIDRYGRRGEFLKYIVEHPSLLNDDRSDDVDIRRYNPKTKQREEEEEEQKNAGADNNTDDGGGDADDNEDGTPLLVRDLRIGVIYGQYVCPYNYLCIRSKSDERDRTNFATVARTVATLYNVMTLEAWTGLLYPMIESQGAVVAGLFFVLVLFVGNFFLLNLTLVVILDAFERSAVLAELVKKAVEETVTTAAAAITGGIVAAAAASATGGGKGDNNTSPTIMNADGASPTAAVVKNGGYALMRAESATLAASPSSSPATPSAAPKVLKKYSSYVATGNSEDKPNHGKAITFAALPFSERKKWFGFYRPFKNFCEFIYTEIVGTTWFRLLSTLVLLFNLIVETTAYAGMPHSHEDLITKTNVAVTIFYIGEVVLKFLAYPFPVWRGDGFNIFDAIVTIVSTVELIFAKNSTFSILRSMRFLKVVSLSSSLRVTLATLVSAFKGAFPILALVFLFIFLFAVLGTQLFAKKYCTGGPFISSDEFSKVGTVFCEGIPRGNFDNIAYALQSVFIISTGEGWRDLMASAEAAAGDEVAVFFFTIAHFVLGYIMVNLFVAIIINSATELKVQQAEIQLQEDEAQRELEEEDYYCNDDVEPSSSSLTGDGSINNTKRLLAKGGVVKFGSNGGNDAESDDIYSEAGSDANMYQNKNSSTHANAGEITISVTGADADGDDASSATGGGSLRRKRGDSNNNNHNNSNTSSATSFLTVNNNIGSGGLSPRNNNSDNKLGNRDGGLTPRRNINIAANSSSGSPRHGFDEVTRREILNFPEEDHYENQTIGGALTSAAGGFFSAIAASVELISNPESNATNITSMPFTPRRRTNMVDLVHRQQQEREAAEEKKRMVVKGLRKKKSSSQSTGTYTAPAITTAASIQLQLAARRRGPRVASSVDDDDDDDSEEEGDFRNNQIHHLHDDDDDEEDEEEDEHITNQGTVEVSTARGVHSDFLEVGVTPTTAIMTTSDQKDTRHHSGDEDLSSDNDGPLTTTTTPAAASASPLPPFALPPLSRPPAGIPMLNFANLRAHRENDDDEDEREKKGEQKVVGVASIIRAISDAEKVRRQLAKNREVRENNALDGWKVVKQKISHNAEDWKIVKNQRDNNNNSNKSSGNSSTDFITVASVESSDDESSSSSSSSSSSNDSEQSSLYSRTTSMTSAVSTSTTPRSSREVGGAGGKGSRRGSKRSGSKRSSRAGSTAALDALGEEEGGASIVSALNNRPKQHRRNSSSSHQANNKNNNNRASSSSSTTALPPISIPRLLRQVCAWFCLSPFLFISVVCSTIAGMVFQILWRPTYHPDHPVNDAGRVIDIVIMAIYFIEMVAKMGYYGVAMPKWLDKLILGDTKAARARRRRNPFIRALCCCFIHRSEERENTLARRRKATAIAAAAAASAASKRRGGGGIGVVIDDGDAFAAAGGEGEEMLIKPSSSSTAAAASSSAANFNSIRSGRRGTITGRKKYVESGRHTRSKFAASIAGRKSKNPLVRCLSAIPLPSRKSYSYFASGWQCMEFLCLLAAIVTVVAAELRFGITNGGFDVSEVTSTSSGSHGDSMSAMTTMHRYYSVGNTLSFESRQAAQSIHTTLWHVVVWGRVVRNTRLWSFVRFSSTTYVLFKALMRSLTTLRNAAIITALFWYMYSVLGLMLFRGKTNACTSYQIIPIADAIAINGGTRDGLETFFRNVSVASVYSMWKYIPAAFDPLTNTSMAPPLPSDPNAFIYGEFAVGKHEAWGDKTFGFPNIDNKAACLQGGYLWLPFPIWNFDNVWHAMLAMFQEASVSDWLTLMFVCTDTRSETEAPKANSNLIAPIYFITFLILMGQFLVNFIKSTLIDGYFSTKGDIEEQYAELRKAKEDAARDRRIARERRREERRRAKLLMTAAASPVAASAASANNLKITVVNLNPYNINLTGAPTSNFSTATSPTAALFSIAAHGGNNVNTNGSGSFSSAAAVVAGGGMLTSSFSAGGGSRQQQQEPQWDDEFSGLAQEPSVSFSPQSFVRNIGSNISRIGGMLTARGARRKEHVRNIGSNDNPLGNHSAENANRPLLQEEREGGEEDRNGGSIRRRRRRSTEEHGKTAHSTTGAIIGDDTNNSYSPANNNDGDENNHNSTDTEDGSSGNNASMVFDPQQLLSASESASFSMQQQFYEQHQRPWWWFSEMSARSNEASSHHFATEELKNANRSGLGIFGWFARAFGIRREKKISQYMLMLTSQERYFFQMYRYALYYVRPPLVVSYTRESNPFRFALRRVFRSRLLEFFQCALAIAHVIGISSMDWPQIDDDVRADSSVYLYRESDAKMSETMRIYVGVDIVCTFVFIFIMFGKMVVYGLWPYVTQRRNWIDILINIATATGCLFCIVAPGSVFWTATRFLLFMRIFRVHYIFFADRGLLVQLQVMLDSGRSFMSVLALMALLLATFASVGMILFGKVVYTSRRGFHSFAGFETFLLGFGTLFRAITGDDWGELMVAASTQAPNCSPQLNDCGNPIAAAIYFMLVIVLGSWVALNLFTAVLMEGLVSAESDDQFPVQEIDVRQFQRQWKALARRDPSKITLTIDELQLLLVLVNTRTLGLNSHFKNFKGALPMRSAATEIEKLLAAQGLMGVDVSKAGQLLAAAGLSAANDGSGGLVLKQCATPRNGEGGEGGEEKNGGSGEKKKKEALSSSAAATATSTSPSLDKKTEGEEKTDEEKQQRLESQLVGAASAARVLMQLTDVPVYAFVVVDDTAAKNNNNHSNASTTPTANQKKNTDENAAISITPATQQPPPHPLSPSSLLLRSPTQGPAALPTSPENNKSINNNSNKVRNVFGVLPYRASAVEMKQRKISEKLSTLKRRKRAVEEGGKGAEATAAGADGKASKQTVRAASSSAAAATTIKAVIGDEDDDDDDDLYEAGGHTQFKQKAKVIIDEHLFSDHEENDHHHGGGIDMNQIRTATPFSAPSSRNEQDNDSNNLHCFIHYFVFPDDVFDGLVRLHYGSEIPASAESILKQQRVRRFRKDRLLNLALPPKGLMLVPPPTTTTTRATNVVGEGSNDTTTNTNTAATTSNLKWEPVKVTCVALLMATTVVQRRWRYRKQQQRQQQVVAATSGNGKKKY